MFIPKRDPYSTSSKTQKTLKKLWVRVEELGVGMYKPEEGMEYGGTLSSRHPTLIVLVNSQRLCYLTLHRSGAINIISKEREAHESTHIPGFYRQDTDSLTMLH